MKLIRVKRINKEMLRLPFHTILHPFDGIEAIKYRKTQSMIINMALLIVWLVSEIVVRKNSGFVFNRVNTEEVNVFDISSGTLAIFLILVIANFLLCTFMDGEGTFSQIFSVGCYATVIMTISNIGSVILTNILSIEMAAFFNLYHAVFYIWLGIYIICAVIAVHQFTFLKAVTNLLLTGVGALLIVGLLFLLYSLFQQVASFFYTLMNEILFRI